jgi:SAM-dependent methyltransferase
MDLDANSLERLVPEELSSEDLGGQETLRLHVERYAFAADHARPGRLLDLACGVGYGTRLVADRRPELRTALGVDVSAAAVAYARDHYADGRVRYLCRDGMQLTDGEGFDTVISLETVEHVPDPERFVSHLVSLLRPEGVLIASVPTTPSVDLNPHHLSDFTARSFRRMGQRHGLVERDCLEQTQRLSPLDLVRGQRFQRDNLRRGLLRYYLAHPQAALRRALATLRHGLANRYLTVVWQREA